MSKAQEYRRGFIYLANLNPIKGSEEGGTRPVLVISNNNGNHHSSILIVAPITTRGSHRMMLTHVKLQRRVKTLDGPAYVMLEQIEPDIQDTVRRMRENEAYQTTIKHDMAYLEGEKMQWTLLRSELIHEKYVLRIASYVVFSAFFLLG